MQTDSTTTAAGHQKRRERRLWFAVLSSALVRPLGALIPVLAIPVFIRYLGPSRYGVYEAVGSLAVWIGATNVGFGYGLLNRLLDCNVSGNRQLAREYVSTLFGAMLVLLTAGTVVITLLTLFVDWMSIFNAEHVTTSMELRWSVWLAMILPLVAASFSMAPVVYSAYQEIHRQNVWEAIAKIGTVLACMAVPTIAIGIPGAILAMAGLPVLVSLANHLHLWFIAKPWIRPNLRLFHTVHLRRLLADAIALFLLAMSVSLMFQLDRLIIGLLRSPDEVASYAVAQRIFMLAYGAFMLVLSPLWPAYGEAFRRGDVAWCRRKLRFTLLWGCLIMGSAGTALAVSHEQVFRLIGGGQKLSIGLPLVAAMTIATILRTWGDSHSVLLNGANVLKPQVALLACTAVLMLVVSPILTLQFGITGTAWSYPIVAVVTTAWGYPYLVRRFVLQGKHAQAGPT